ncbi:MAG: lipoyl(octanoyl) transferase LipB [Hyphomicrobium sp.]|nr:lipoyl(octanoyl) transferase LipB [Hyphomicrobium sp.]
METPDTMIDGRPKIRLLRAQGPVLYPAALSFMAHEADAIADGRRPELLWFLEHPPILTRGLRGRDAHLIEETRFPVFETDRGGEITYHGPGQRIVYALLDVRRHTGGDVRAFVRLLETCMIEALDTLGVAATSDVSRPGVWVQRSDLPGGEAKIGAIGLKVRRGISLHGMSLNVAPDLSSFEAIVPCGLEGSSVTSLAELGAVADLETVDNSLMAAFSRRLGPLEPVREGDDAAHGGPERAGADEVPDGSPLRSEPAGLDK